MYFSLLIEGAPFVGHDANDHNLLLKGRPFIMRFQELSSARVFGYDSADMKHWRFQELSSARVFGYDSADMKHWRLLTVVLVAVALSVIGVRHVLEKRAQQKHVLEKRAQQKREVAYKAALRSYSEVLRPGVTRNEVESYLRAENVRFGQMCCVDPTDLSKGVYDELTEIGQEDAPWFCSEMNIYVAFQFTGPDRHAVGWTVDASDPLNSVSIYR